jgi:MYND finger
MGLDDMSADNIELLAFAAARIRATGTCSHGAPPCDRDNPLVWNIMGPTMMMGVIGVKSALDIDRQTAALRGLWDEAEQKYNLDQQCPVDWTYVRLCFAMALDSIVGNPVMPADMEMAFSFFEMGHFLKVRLQMGKENFEACLDGERPTDITTEKWHQMMQEFKQLYMEVLEKVHCPGSLVLFLLSQTPCRCLDALARCFEDHPPGHFERDLNGHPPVCFHCRKAPTQGELKKCSRCKKVEYCSTECQKADWPEHKKTCKPLQKGKKGSNCVMCGNEIE